MVGLPWDMIGRREYMIGRQDYMLGLPWDMIGQWKSIIGSSFLRIWTNCVGKTNKSKEVRLLLIRRLPDEHHILYSESWMTFEFLN
jgi:hypothetical protein